MKNIKQARQFILEQKTIRMAHRSSPGGYGNEAAFLHYISWLRRVIGFQGRIEVFYDNRAGTYKLIKLLGREMDFVPGDRLELTDTFENVVLISLESFIIEWDNYEPINLIINTDSAEEIAYGYGCSAENFYKAHYAVLFNHDPSFVDIDHRSMLFSTPSFKDAVSFLNQPFSEFLLSRKPGIADLMLKIVQKKVVTWSLYGLARAFARMSPVRLIQDLREIAHEVFLQRSEMIPGPVLLLLHNELSPHELSALKEIMPLTDVRDPLFSMQIQREAGEVILVNVGALSMVLTEAIFKKSLFPLLLEGMSSEPIMLMRGLPYLDCGIDGSPSDSYVQEFIKIFNVSKEIREQFKMVGDICLHRKMSSDLKDAIVQFIKDSWVPHSELRRFMVEVKDYYFKAGDRSLHRVARRLSNKPAVLNTSQKFSPKTLLPGEINCNNPVTLLVHGKPDQISKCLEAKTLDLTVSIKGDLLAFFPLLFNAQPGIPEFIEQYLKQNLIICGIVSKNPQCSQWMRDCSLTGREHRKKVKSVISYCQPLSNQSSLQDIISNFCGETLSPLAPAKKSAQELMQFLTVNLTLTSQLLLSEAGQKRLPSSEKTDLPLFEGLIWAGITLTAVATLVLIGRRQCKKIAGFLQTSGEWLLWGRNCNPRPNQHESHDPGHHPG